MKSGLLSFSGNFPMISDDLVNSYHLLLCALDLIFTNALLCNARKELLNPNFKGNYVKNLWLRDFQRLWMIPVVILLKSKVAELVTCSELNIFLSETTDFTCNKLHWKAQYRTWERPVGIHRHMFSSHDFRCASALRSFWSWVFVWRCRPSVNQRCSCEKRQAEPWCSIIVGVSEVCLSLLTLSRAAPGFCTLLQPDWSGVSPAGMGWSRFLLTPAASCTSSLGGAAGSPQQRCAHTGNLHFTASFFTDSKNTTQKAETKWQSPPVSVRFLRLLHNNSISLCPPKQQTCVSISLASEAVLALCASGLPEDFSSKDYRPSPGPLCFMDQLCELHDGLVLEAKGVKEHFWKPFIKKLFHKRVRAAAVLSLGLNLVRFVFWLCPFLSVHLRLTQILRGKEDSLTGFLDPINFGDSLWASADLYSPHSSFPLLFFDLSAALSVCLSVGCMKNTSWPAAVWTRGSSPARVQTKRSALLDPACVRAWRARTAPPAGYMPAWLWDHALIFTSCWLSGTQSGR